MNLTELWKHLEEDTRVTEGPRRLQRRLVPAGRRDFFLGLEMPSRNRMLILRVSTNSAEGQPEVPDSRGLSVRVVPRERESNAVEVELALTEQDHRDIFDLLVRDLVAAAEGPGDERTGLTRFLARLANWQQLLRRLPFRGLTRGQQQGLWGELWVLKEVIAPVAGVIAAVDGWRGPMGEHQDFQIGAMCIEAKTSTEATLDRLLISSERQLEVPADVALLLLGLSLDGRPDHGETLPELVEAVRSAASGSGCLHLLDPRLDLSGYSAADADRYSDIGYSLRSMHPFRVEEGFPRIVSDDLQAGVSGVQYQLSTASCRQYQITLQETTELLEDLLYDNSAHA